MKRWLDRRVWFAELVGACSVFTAIYGFGHLLELFGVDFPLVGMSRFGLGLFGVSLTISGVAGVLITRRVVEQDRIDRERLDRESPSKAIRDRAAQDLSIQGRAWASVPAMIVSTLFFAYAIVHVLGAFGIVGAEDETSAIAHIGYAILCAAVGSTGYVWGNHDRRRDRRRDLMKYGAVDSANRDKMAEAIWDRAHQNKGRGIDA